MAKSLPACLFVKGCFQGSAVGSLRRQTALRFKEITTFQALLHWFGFKVFKKKKKGEKKEERKKGKKKEKLKTQQQYHPNT